MCTFNSALIAVVTLACVHTVHAFFRINCYVVQTGRIDPIINPGAISAHAHTIVGASNIGVNSTYESLYNSECTSCEIGKDKSSYWTPNLYYEYANGSFFEVPHDGSVVYYTTRGPNENDLTVFPQGFRMVSGNKSNRSYNQSGMTWGNATFPSRPVSEAVSFACLSQNIGPDTYNLVDVRSCINGLRAQIHFQTCWNGKDLYKADNSHVAHTNQIDDGVCHPSYPYQLPHVFLETNYAVVNVPGNDDGGRYVFSQGDPTGYGFHGDFFNAWETDTFTRAIETCLLYNGAPFGTIDECPVLIESDTRVAAANCPVRPSQIDEPVHGLISKLPGCITVTEGPNPATAADMECAAGVPQPAIFRTVNSTPLPTYTPSIGQPIGNPYNVNLGCGNDSYGSPMRAVAARVTDNQTSMSVEYCQDHCNTRGYRVSAVQFGSQCWCDLTVNPSTIFTSNFSTRDGCINTCPGNRSELCGGPNYVNVYNNTDPAFVPTTDLTYSVIALTVPPAPYIDTYIGCASEATIGGQRALNGSEYHLDNMTIAYCRSRCQADNYAYYGLEYTTQCFCGNGLASGARLVDTLLSPLTGSSCNSRCAGDFSQVCGQGGYLSLYSNPLWQPTVVTRNVGRYLNKGCVLEPAKVGTGARALAGGSLTTTPDMSPQVCVGTCLRGGYRYAGIENGNQCFCADTLSAGANSTACDTDVLRHCPGDQTAFCGAANLLNLYYSATL
ncbi:hypothetical protein AAFC00_002959 [Neodothiora populina]|uniref:WSC domain-containing protein n=1 Tax=Neodothiora populina TaxID=2781224 RepID=A0ABR3P927_9PEZI